MMRIEREKRTDKRRNYVHKGEKYRIGGRDRNKIERETLQDFYKDQEFIENE